jgi:Helix-turn-helix domain
VVERTLHNYKHRFASKIHAVSIGENDMTQYMKMNEVAAYLGKCNDQVRRYRGKGLLPAHKTGKELFYDRAAVIEFAQARGIRTAETVQPASDITVVNLPLDKKRELAARVEGYTGQYQRKEIDVEQYTQAVIAASGTRF